MRLQNVRKKFLFQCDLEIKRQQRIKKSLSEWKKNDMLFCPKSIPYLQPGQWTLTAPIVLKRIILFYTYYTLLGVYHVTHNPNSQSHHIFHVYLYK